MRIVVIDEDPQARQAARRALEAEGYEVAEAADRGTGLALRQAAKGDVSPVMGALTSNGYRILPAPGGPDDAVGVVRFRVEGRREAAEVEVSVRAEAVDRVRRLTGRALAPTGSFFRLQAEFLLAACLTIEDRIPRRQLAITDVSEEDLEVARVWENG